MKHRNRLLPALLLALSGPACGGALWSSTEIHYQNGRLDAPSFAGGGDARTSIVTLQNATGWEHLDLFVFVDIINDNDDNGFNDSDLYSELYLGGGFGKLFGHDGGFGPFRDIGWAFGVNYADDAKVRKFLPGIRLYWNAPGFAFLNTDITAYIDDSSGVSSGGAPKESDSYMIDFAWAYPFEVGGQAFSIEGHMEYIDGRRNEFGGPVSSWFLAQPQFRWDAGKAFFDKPGRFFLGFEYQYWNNKLGDPATDESAVQLLAVWKLH